MDDWGISFNQEYKNVKKVPELLFRASLVQSLIQIDGVDSVKLYIGGVHCVMRMVTKSEL